MHFHVESVESIGDSRICPVSQLEEQNQPTGKLAFVFPGQGSQRVGMGKALVERYDVAKKTYEAADEALGYSISELCFEGPEDRLRLTANAQPAILTTSIAVWRVLCAEVRNIEGVDWGPLVPDAVAGHSLGEYSALVCAGALDLADAVRLVHKRGQYMQEAVPPDVGAMAAVMGVDAQTVERLCARAREDHVLEPANFNGPSQIVVAGHAEAVRRVAELGTKEGATTRMLKVSAPFHCPLMEPAAVALRGALEEVEINPFAFPVVGNVEAKPYAEAGRVVDLLTRQVTAPVRWDACVHKLLEMGIREILELGGSTLAKLIRSIDKSVQPTAVETPEDIEAVSWRLDTELERFTRMWREGNWHKKPNGIRSNADGTHLVLPMGIEWRWDDPTAHGF